MALLTPSAGHALRGKDLLAFLRLHFRRPPRRTDASDSEDCRQRRAFVEEMLSRNPDAFASAEDVRAMMQFFPERF